MEDFVVYDSIHTHLRGEQLSRDDLTDLTLLKLDAIAVIQSKIDGFPGGFTWAI